LEVSNVGFCSVFVVQWNGVSEGHGWIPVTMCFVAIQTTFCVGMELRLNISSLRGVQLEIKRLTPN
jgi:hypothetical protein